MGRVLVDTGAIFSAISPDMVDRLSLPRFKGQLLRGRAWDGALISTDTYATTTIEGSHISLRVHLPVLTTPSGMDVVLGRDAKHLFKLSITADDRILARDHELFNHTLAAPHHESMIPTWQHSDFIKPMALANLAPDSPDFLNDDADITDFIQRHDLERELRAHPDEKLEFYHIELYAVTSPTTPSATTAPEAAHDHIVQRIIETNVDVFATQLPQLPPERDTNFTILLQDGATLRMRRPYRMGPAERDALTQICQRMLRVGLISRTHGPGASPAFLVRKPPGPNGEPRWRMVIDARGLNRITVPHIYTPQYTDDAIRALAGKCIFSAIDLVDAFYQVRADPSAQNHLSFTTPDGNYVLNVMPMGAKNSTETLTRVIHDCFQPLISTGRMVAYADDIVIMSENIDAHERDLDQFFQLCRQHKFFIHPHKSKFFVDHVKFLGHMVGGNSVSPLHDRIADLMNIPAPTNATEVRSFIGATNYYREHIPNYAIIASPLHELTGKAPFNWTPVHDDAFNRLKHALASAVTLAQPDFATRPTFDIYTDASSKGIGAAIHQNNRPLAFFSKTLSSAEANYAVRELELLAIKRVLDQYDHWLAGAHIRIHTDHESLKYLTTCDVSKRLARFLDPLQLYDLEFIYVPGPDNVVADMLSRRSDHPTTLLTPRASTISCVPLTRPRPPNHHTPPAPLVATLTLTPAATTSASSAPSPFTRQ